jgi:hypothetical protein
VNCWIVCIAVGAWGLSIHVNYYIVECSESAEDRQQITGSCESIASSRQGVGADNADLYVEKSANAYLGL